MSISKFGQPKFTKEELDYILKSEKKYEETESYINEELPLTGEMFSTLLDITNKSN